MATKQLSIIFEPDVPVAGQILILEAVDFLYSLGVLKDVGWSEQAQRLPDWHRFASTSPGKLLASENVLRVRSAHSSVVTEIVGGIDKGIELLKTLIDRLKQLRAGERAQAKLRIIREEILPLIEKLRKQGASEDRINRMVENAAVYVEEVLVNLMLQDKLKIEAA